jgi:predicted small lipoprotein YifL
MSDKIFRYSLISFSLILLLLSGCGQKGPLLLPDEKPAINLIAY